MSNTGENKARVIIRYAFLTHGDKQKTGNSGNHCF